MSDLLVLDDRELDVAKEIINIALAKAADSLSFFVHKRIMMKVCNLGIEPFDKDNKIISKDNGEMIVLKTEIKGELDGSCYLVFSKDEAEKIASASMKNYSSTNEEQKAEMQKALLMEIDNIVTASVVTQFSNLLKLKLHGYIPIYNLMKADQFNSFVAKENEKYSTVLRFETELFNESEGINPEFVWFMNHEKFIACIKNLPSGTIIKT